MRLSVAVRALCAFTARAGDLDLRFTPAPSAAQGVHSHQQVQRQRQAAQPRYEAEVPLQGQWHNLHVRGRADGYDPTTHTLEEIKTTRTDAQHIKANQLSLIHI